MAARQLTMASAGTNDVSIAFANINCTILEFADAVFTADVLVSMCKPSWDAAFERKLARSFLSSTAPSPFRGANAPLTKHKFPLLFAPELPHTLSATLVRHECTSSNGQTERLAGTPPSDSEATASEFLTCGPDVVSLAPNCNHAERTDLADRAADVARNDEGISNEERDSAERGRSRAPFDHHAGLPARGRSVQRETLRHTILTFWKEWNKF